jgi:hypothetical protein
MKTTQVLFYSYLFLIAIPVQSLKAEQCQGNFCDTRCPSGIVYVQGETATYNVVICSEKKVNNPAHYIGENKINGSIIILPLTSSIVDMENNNYKFVARNGKFTYTLIFDKNDRLIIKSPGKKARIETFTVKKP